MAFVAEICSNLDQFNFPHVFCAIEVVAHCNVYYTIQAKMQQINTTIPYNTILEKISGITCYGTFFGSPGLMRMIHPEERQLEVVVSMLIVSQQLATSFKDSSTSFRHENASKVSFLSFGRPCTVKYCCDFSMKCAIPTYLHVITPCSVISDSDLM